MNVDVEEYNCDQGHKCSKCRYLLDEIACWFDNLLDLKTRIAKDITMSLLFIVGCVTRKDCSTEEELCNSPFYFQECCNFLKEMDRDNLKNSTEYHSSVSVFLFL